MPRNCTIPGCDRKHPILADWMDAHPEAAHRATYGPATPQPYVALPVSRLTYFRRMHSQGEEL